MRFAHLGQPPSSQIVEQFWDSGDSRPRKKAFCLKETAVRADVEMAKTKNKNATRVAVLARSGSTAVRHSHPNLTNHITVHKRLKPRNRNGSPQRLQMSPTSTKPRKNHQT